MSAKQENTVMLIVETIWKQSYNVYLLLFCAFLASLAQF